MNKITKLSFLDVNSLMLQIGKTRRLRELFNRELSESSLHDFSDETTGETTNQHRDKKRLQRYSTSIYLSFRFHIFFRSKRDAKNTQAQYRTFVKTSSRLLRITT